MSLPLIEENTVSKISTRDSSAISAMLATRSPFETHGALSGVSGVARTGWLPLDWRRTYEARSNVIEYTILSYDTPIAWLDGEAGWIVPDEKYSMTTSIHQSRIRGAITRAGEYYSE